FGGRRVCVANKMEDSMNDDSMQFFVEADAELLGVVPDAVDTNIDVAHKESLPAPAVKGEDIRVVIVLEVATVKIKQVVVRTENKVDFPQVDFFSAGYGLKPACGLARMR